MGFESWPFLHYFYPNPNPWSLGDSYVVPLNRLLEQSVNTWALWAGEEVGKCIAGKQNAH